MRLKISILMILSLIFTNSLMADAREENPFQIQYLPTNGVSVGYHISKSIYLGASYTNNVTFTDDFSYQFEDRKYDQKGHDETEYHQGTSTTLDFRYSPWDIGLYFNLSYLIEGESNTESKFDKENRQIGDNLYDTALTIKVEREEWSGAAIGGGYNHVFESGISLGIGAMVGLTKREDPKITITTDTGVTLSTSDKNQLIKDIEKEEYDYVGSGYIAIGYNF